MITTIDDRDYVKRPAHTPANGIGLCNGCAGHDDSGLCKRLPEECGDVTADGELYIWVEVADA